MGRNTSKGPIDSGGTYMSIPTLEAHLRAYVQAGDAPNALSCFERLLRRQRTPQAATCAALLGLCAAQGSARDALYVLECMCEGARSLDVEE